MLRALGLPAWAGAGTSGVGWLAHDPSVLSQNLFVAVPASTFPCPRTHFNHVSEPTSHTCPRTHLVP